MRGRIRAVTTDAVDLAPESAAVLTLPIAELTRARIEVEFGRVDDLDDLDDLDELNDASEEDD